jgi:sugar phosphate isomerase/epimerase
MIQASVFSDELSLDFAETVRLCAELRVPFIDPREGLFGRNINEIGMDEAIEMKRLMDRYGVRVGCIGSGFGKCSLTDEDEWKQHLAILERQFRFADLWGTRLLRMFPFWLPEPFDWRSPTRPDFLSRYLPQVVDRLRVACKLAEREGITFTMEAEGSTFSGTCPEIRTIIDAVGSKALTACWDVVNSWSYGRVGWPDDYPYVKGLVTHLHIKDATFDPQNRARSTGYTHIDLGEVPWVEIFRTLNADGYNGLAGLETHLFFGMANRHRWLQPATISALRNLNRVLAEAQGHL